MLLQNLLTVIYFACGIFLFLLAWLIVRENPRQTINRILSVLLFFAAIATVLTAFGFLIEESTSINLDRTTLNIAFIAWQLFFPQLFLFALVFPSQSKILKSHPRLYIPLYLPPVIHMLLLSVFDSSAGIVGLIDTKNLLPALGIIFEPVRLVIGFFLYALSLLREYHSEYFGFVNLLYIGAALMIMHISYARITSPRLRSQIRLVLWGVRVSTGLYAISFLLPEILRIEMVWWHPHVLTVIGLILGIIAITWAIIRHQFLEIQYIIRRGFIVSATSGLLAGGYLLFYGQVNRLARLVFNDNASLVQALLLIFTVIAFQPVLNLVEWAVDRLFGKGLGDSQAALRQLSHEVLTLLDPVQLRERIVNGLSESMLLEVVYLLLPSRNDDFEAPAATETGKAYSLPRHSDAVSILYEERRPVYVSELFLQKKDDELFRETLRQRVHLLVPLCHRGRLLGVLAIGRKITHTSFSYEEMNLLSLLADQVAITLENIQLAVEKLEKERYEKEVAVAREIQQLLLPQCLPESAAFEVAALNIPSREIGGDFYDFVEISDNLTGLAIGDVSGKGIPGAILMSNLQAVFRANAMQNTAPQTVVSKVNDHLASSISPEKFVTFFYGIFDTRKQIFAFTNAGHNFPLLYRKQSVEMVPGADLIVGVRPHSEYRQQKLKVRTGDVLLLYTDGITEALDDAESLYGEKRLSEFLQQNGHLPANEIIQKLHTDLINYTGQTQFSDDLTIVLFRVK
ncbi:MAG: SpoIIE family protein phosphatase [Deferribacteres bacterium]|nr:SpoIIE family protein phosphatase [Deferribacteres bacterium]